EQINQTTQNAAFGLAAQSQQNKIVTGEQRIDDLRHNRIFITVNSREKRLLAVDQAEKNKANFVFDGTRDTFGVEIGNALQFTKSTRLRVLRVRLHRCANGHQVPKWIELRLLLLDLKRLGSDVGKLTPNMINSIRAHSQPIG